MGVSKSFGTHITEKITLATCSNCFLVGCWITWAKNAHIGPKMPVLGQIWPKIPEKNFRFRAFWGSPLFYPILSQKKHPKFLKRLIFILEKGTFFFFEQLSRFVARTWLELRSEFFLPYDPNFGQQPICSPGRDRSFPTVGAIFRLFVPELWLFS